MRDPRLGPESGPVRRKKKNVKMKRGVDGNWYPAGKLPAARGVAAVETVEDLQRKERDDDANKQPGQRSIRQTL